MAVVAMWWQHGGGQRGSSVGQCGGSAAAGSMATLLAAGGGGAGSMLAAASLAAVAEVWRHCSISGGSRAAGAVLLPRTATVAMKTPVATAMAGALPTINNQLKAAAAMAMETMTTTTIKM